MRPVSDLLIGKPSLQLLRLNLRSLLTAIYVDDADTCVTDDEVGADEESGWLTLGW